MIGDVFFVLIAENEHIIFKSDEVQILIKYLRRDRTVWYLNCIIKMSSMLFAFPQEFIEL